MNTSIFKNQKGVTLLELLASLTILSIILVLMSGILLNSMNYFETSKNKISLSQEANKILAQLTTIHQTTKEYTLNSSTTADGIKQIKINEKIVKHPDLHIEIVRAGQTEYLPFATSIDIKTRNPLFIELKVTDITKTGNNFTIRTVINRY